MHTYTCVYVYMYCTPETNTTLSCSVLSDFCNPMDCSPPGSSVHGDSSGKNTGVKLENLTQHCTINQLHSNKILKLSKNNINK